jgi:hypothetical protein
VTCSRSPGRPPRTSQFRQTAEVTPTDASENHPSWHIAVLRRARGTPFSASRVRRIGRLLTPFGRTGFCHRTVGEPQTGITPLADRSLVQRNRGRAAQRHSCRCGAFMVSDCACRGATRGCRRLAARFVAGSSGEIVQRKTYQRQPALPIRDESCGRAGYEPRCRASRRTSRWTAGAVCKTRTRNAIDPARRRACGKNGFTRRTALWRA